MKISKHLHSCLLIEEENKTFLIDPGVFTYQEKALNFNSLSSLDYILITHEHSDHAYIPLIKEIIAKFPTVEIITNPSAATLLKQEDITALTAGNGYIQLEDVSHEKLWDITPPQNVLFKLFNELTHPGDSHHFNQTTDVLALPITAPWGSTTDAVNLALKLKPKIIIPIHDWMWKDVIRQEVYVRLQTYFAKEGIDFKPLETGEIVEV